ncbi:MAG: hypothetical protein ACYCS8_01800 [Acidithiobacillus sp.]
MIKQIRIWLVIDTDAIDYPVPGDFGKWSAMEVMGILSSAKTKVVGDRRLPAIIDSNVEDLGNIIPGL